MAEPFAPFPVDRIVAGLLSFANVSSVSVLVLGAAALAYSIATAAQAQTAGVKTVLTNLAFPFVLAGIALLLRLHGKANPRLAPAAALCGLGVAGIGLARLAGLQGSWGTGAAAFLPMTAPAAALFVLLGVALAFLDSEDRHGRRPAQLLALVVALFTIVAFGASLLVRPATGSAVAGPYVSGPAALGFMLLALGALAARPDRGWMRVLAADAVGGEVARRLLPPAVLAPVLLLIVCFLGFQAGWYDSRSGLILLTTLNSAVLTALVWRAAVALNATDARRSAMEAERNELNIRLQRAMAETHHRVRNNLQIISALADMQVMTGSESVPVSEMKRISGQVQALAAVHDILTHETKQDASADTVSAEEVLNQLAGLLQKTIHGRSIIVRTDPARITGRQASALVVIANELITNALKNSDSDVRVEFVAGDATARLVVMDRGRGFPAGFNPTTDSNTGLDLVQQISGWDLQGSVEFTNGPEGGGRVVVQMPLTAPGQVQAAV